jgi:hypothetical protein
VPAHGVARPAGAGFFDFPSSSIAWVTFVRSKTESKSGAVRDKVLTNVGAAPSHDRNE